MIDVNRLSKPQRFVLQKMKEGSVLRSRLGSNVSPWLEHPGTTKVTHVSYLTFVALFDYSLITLDEQVKQGTINTWKLREGIAEALP